MSENFPVRPITSAADFQSCGMMILDYFAMKATDKDVDDFVYQECNGTRIPVRNRVDARWAFARAMLAARNNP
jgi:hypothetical protein